MISRRTALLGGLAFSACGGGTSLVVDAGSTPEGPGWEEFSLADYPELGQPGGSAVLERPAALINVWVLHLDNGTFAAVWRVCTHGACEVAPKGRQFECPCHGSIFALDGSVVQGPAVRPLRRFEAVRAGGSLYLRRT